LDKKVTDSGEILTSPPLLIDEDSNIYESMNKVPLFDRNGEVFALLVCVYRFTREVIDRQDYATQDHRDTKSTHLWAEKQSLPDNPALFTANNERIRAEELKHASERAFIAKNRFIATASHDLRQPLHAIGLYIGALEKSVNEDGYVLIDKLKSCVGSLNELLTSLLDISKLDANVVLAETCDVSIGELLQSLQTECQSIARSKKLDIHCNTDGSLVRSDPVLLRRVIRNLLMNAINHTWQGNITLTAHRMGNHVEVIVSDTGVGIPLEKQDLVFEEFAKLESENNESQQGLGLGLSIVKRLCVLLDIRLRLESLVNKGTRISMMVPLGSSSVEEYTKEEPTHDKSPAEESDPGDSENARKTILVIDDDREVCEAVETILLHTGYQVLSAISPADAIRQMQKFPDQPDAMLVDFRLSEDMTGLDAIAIISKHLGFSIPTLIVTGDTTDGGLREISGSGYPHLHKPVAVGELLKKVEETLVVKNAR